MRKKIFIPISVFLLITAIITGATFTLNKSIVNAQDAEDYKIVTAPAIEPKTNPDVNSLENITLLDDLNTEAFESKLEIVEAEKGSDDIPSEKDLPMEEAGLIAADALKKYFNANIKTGRMEMQFSKEHSAVITNEAWLATFEDTTNKVIYCCSIDSVTGQVYSVISFNQHLNGDSKPLDSDQDQIVLESEQADMTDRLNDEAYKTAACDFIKTNFPGTEIVSSENICNGSSGNISSVVTEISEDSESSTPKFYYDDIVVTNVTMSDGSGYSLTIGAVTHDIISFSFYPNGVE